MLRLGGLAVALLAASLAHAGERVVIHDTRAAAFAGPVGSAVPVPREGELLTRQDGVCLLTHYSSTKTTMPMPVVRTQTYPCDAQGRRQ